MEFLCFLLWAFFSIAKYLRYSYAKHCCVVAFPSSFLPLRGDEKRLIEHLLAPCKESCDSHGFWIPRHRFRIPGSGYRSLCSRNLDSGFHSLVGSVILSCIPDSKTQDSGFQKENIPRIPNFSNRPFYRYGGHIELIRFKEYYRMPRGHEHISFVFSSAFWDIFS